MKLVSRIATFILIAFLFAQSVLVVEAKGENKKPDPHFRDKAMHVEKSRTPYYGNEAVVDIYLADSVLYSVDIVTQDVVGIEPEVMSYQVDATYNEEQLRGMAETMITDFIGDKVKLDKLSYSLGQKIGTYFFRWEDADKQLDSGIYPFIQVGLSQNGDFLNFVNTLPFGKNFASLQAPKVQMMPVQAPYLIGPFNQIYANGGSYWTPTTWTWSSGTGGYFGTAPIPAGCSGTFCTKYYYTTARSSAYVYGKWTPNSNTSTQASAYIPAYNATATVQYVIQPRSGGTTIYTIVDQNAWTGWKRITPSTVANGISYVQLWDVGFNGTGTSSYKVGWDELWVYNP